MSLVRKGDIASEEGMSGEEDGKQPLLKHVWPQVCSFVGLFRGVPCLPLISVFFLISRDGRRIQSYSGQAEDCDRTVVWTYRVKD